MKSIPLVFLCLAMSGCTLPQKTYHAIKLSHRRSEALPLDQLRTAVVVSTQPASLFGPMQMESVLVRARFLGDPSWNSDQANASAQQTVESLFAQDLLNKGYHVASRLNLPAVQMEQAFPTGRIAPGSMQSLFKGTHLLLITISRRYVGPKQYEWDEGLEGTHIKWFVGTEASFHLHAELISVQTSASIWVSEVRLHRVLRGDIPQPVIFDQTLRILAETIPARTVSKAGP